jgi:hypothetical protein
LFVRVMAAIAAALRAMFAQRRLQGKHAKKRVYRIRLAKMPRDDRVLRGLPAS